MSENTDAISWFLNRAGKIPLLTHEEEILLSRRVQAMVVLREANPAGPYTKEENRVLRAGERAKERMITANLRLVVSIAKRYVFHVRTLDLSDLVQEGMFGLVRGVEKFDPERGYKASTYLYWWIRQGITRAISQQDRTVRLPINAIDCLSKVRNWAPSFIRDHHRPPTPQECADYCGVTIHVMQGYLTHASGCGSLDAKAQNAKGEKNNSSLVDLIESTDTTPMEELEKDSLLCKLDIWLDRLNEKERTLINLRHGIDCKGEGLSQIAVAKRMGCTRQNVQQLERRVMTKLRKAAMQGVAA